MRIHRSGRHHSLRRPRRFHRFGWEQLESRWLLAGGDVDLTLDVWLDQFGYQPEISQAYEDKVSFGSIFDTGASLVSFSATDQYLFESYDTGGGGGIPIKVPGGAQAEGIGGMLIGDVSQPGTVLVDGFHTSVWSMDIFSDESGLYFDQIQGRGSVDDATPTAAEFSGSARLNAEDGLYAQDGFQLMFTSTDAASSANLGVSRLITGYDGDTRTFTFSVPFPQSPVSGDTFHILVGQGVTAGPLPARDRLSAAGAGVGLSDANGAYVGRYLLFTSGELAGESQLITGYEGASHTFNCALSFSQRPSVGDTFDIIVGTGRSAVMPGVQAFIGTTDGSELLSTLGGTPMLNPTSPAPVGASAPNPALPQPMHPNGLALKVGPQNLLLDLGEVLGDLFPDGIFDGITMPIPSVEFREPGTQLEVLESFHAESAVAAGSLAPARDRFAGGGDLPHDPDQPELFRDFYTGFYLRFLTGSLAGEVQEVASYDSAARTFTVNAPFSAPPTAGDLFELVRISTAPLTLRLDLIEFDNHLDPGDIVTVSPNPVSPSVRLAQGAASGHVVSVPAVNQLSGDTGLSDLDDAYTGLTLVLTSGPLVGERAVIADYAGATRTFQLQTPLSGTPASGTTFDLFDESAVLDDQVFLFDTGAQLSVISTAEAEALGLAGLPPEFTASVQGAGGVVADLPGYTLDELSIPTLEGGRLILRNAPVFVLDVAPMLDGILGMNLFNSAAEFLYDPFNPRGYPTLQVTFFEERAEVVTEIDVEGADAATLLAAADLMPLAFSQAVGIREISMPSYGVGVDLDLTPQTGVVAEQDGVTVVTVAPGTEIPFTAEVRYTAESYDAFRLDFSGSDAALRLRDWTTDPDWSTTTDGTLNVPGDPAVNAQGDAEWTSTLGTFVVAAPQTPGEYVLTARDAAGQTRFSLTGEADPRGIRDFGGIVIRVQETPALSVSDAALIEGDTGTVQQLEFTVTLTGQSNVPLAVDYATADGSATLAGGDYSAAAGTLHFAIGETRKTFTVPVSGDAIPEDDEHFVVNLSNPRAEVAPLELIPVSDATAVNLGGGLFDPFDELEPLGETELRAGASPTSRAFALEFDLDAVPAGATIISATLRFVETTDTVDSGFWPASVYGYAGDSDGLVTLANPFNVLLSDSLGDVGNRSVGTQTLDVTSFVATQVAGASRYGGFYVESLLDEYYIHSREAASSADRPRLTIEWTLGPVVIDLVDPQGMGLIRNDDTELSIADRQQPEGNQGDTQTAFVVQLSHPSALEVSVDYATAAGSADPGVDYRPQAGRVAFAPGETAKAVLIPILGDPWVESDETFSVALAAPRHATLSPANGSGTGTIRNEDVIAVLDFASRPAGFVAGFNGVLDTSELNLYDGGGAGLGAADVMVRDEAGQLVRGSLQIAGGRQAATWIPTGESLPPGEYTVTLTSGAAAFRDVVGNSLDGDADGTPGGDYVRRFTVAASGQRVVSLPDAAVGAGQAVQIPASAAGWPICLDHADGVTSLAADVVYDPGLLSISGATRAAAIPADWTVAIDVSTPGVARFTAAGATPLAGAGVEVLRLSAAVPNTAPYGASQGIRIENVLLNGGAIAGVGDVAVHKTAYLGDTDGSGVHSSADAFLVVQAALGLASGFAAHAWTDPRIVGDVDGSGVLSASDAFLIVQEGLGLDEPFVPDNPDIPVTLVGGGVDPQFRIDTGIPAVAGAAVTVPVRLDIEAAATNVGGIDFDLFFDPALVTINVPAGVTRGADTTTGWAVSSRLIAPGQLRVAMLNAQGLPLATGLRSIVQLQFQVAAAAGNTTATLDIEPLDPHASGYTWTAVDGSLAITVPNLWHNTANRYDVNGDGDVTPLDALLVINYINAHPNDPSLPTAPETPPPYYDVSDDRLCTALDVLIVINYLNAQAAPAGEGEAAQADTADGPDRRFGYWSPGFEFEDVLGQIANDIAWARGTPDLTIGWCSQR